MLKNISVAATTQELNYNNVVMWLMQRTSTISTHAPTFPVAQNRRVLNNISALL